MTLDDVTIKITEVLANYSIDKAVLFGSRARGDHTPLSDYDIAIYTHALPVEERYQLLNDIDELPTLKKIQLVFMDEFATEQLERNIQQEGVVLYERCEQQNQQL